MGGGGSAPPPHPAANGPQCDLRQTNKQPGVYLSPSSPTLICWGRSWRALNAAARRRSREISLGGLRQGTGSTSPTPRTCPAETSAYLAALEGKLPLPQVSSQSAMRRGEGRDTSHSLLWRGRGGIFPWPLIEVIQAQNPEERSPQLNTPLERDVALCFPQALKHPVNSAI